jgi:hypothetical protein
MSNALFIWIPTINKSSVIIIPDGCYSASTLQAVLQNSINTTLGVSYFAVTIDPISNRTTIYTTNKYEFEMSLYNTDNKNNSSKFEQCLGWTLGYRKNLYQTANSYSSEGLFSSAPLDYLFFVLNDYHIYNSSNLIAMFNDSYIDKNILAKIPYSNTTFKVLFDGKNDVLSPKRQYFGPIDIKKMGLQLLNKYGQIVNLNCMDFSFTLEVEMIYDI